MKLITLDKIPLTKIERIKTNIDGFDKLLDGGFIKSQAVLLAGEPGVGKSTFLLEVADSLARQGNKILYSSGEENLNQLKLRASKLEISNPNIYCSEETNLEELYKAIYEANPTFIIVDSLQTISSNSLKQAPGNGTQTKYCLSSLIDYVKEKDKILIVIGHSTKSGLIAGLLTLQHMVDTSLFMTIDVEGVKKLIVKKNRFGPSKIEWVMNNEILQHSKNLNGYKKVIVTYEEIQEMLGKSFINRLVVGGDLRWIYREKTDLDFNNVKRYNIIYEVEC